MRIAAQLADAGLIEAVDTYLLACAALAWGDVVTGERVRAEQGWFATGSTGQVVLGPWMKRRHDALLEFERLINHLPLSPVARARLGLAGLRAASIAQAMNAELGVVEGEVVDDVDVGLPGM